MNHKTPQPGPSRRLPLRALMVGLLTWSAMNLRAAPATLPQPPIVIQFSHVVAPDTAKGKGALRFKELAEARTGGRVRVDVFPNSQLYKDREELEALQLGAVQMLAPSLSKLSSIGGTDFEAFDLPYLFRDRAAFRAVADGPLGAAMMKKLEPRGVKGLAFWDNGFKVVTANRPLRRVADFQNLRVRVQSSRILTSQMHAMGALPTVTPLSSVQLALKQGVVEAEESVPSNIYTQHIHEVQKHLTVSHHGYLAYAVIVNKKFWDGLPAALRSTLEGAMRDASQYANQIAEEENRRALELIRASGRVHIHQLSASEQQEWRETMTRIYPQARGWIEPKTIDAILAAAGPPP